MRASLLLAVFAVPAFLAAPLRAQPIFSLKPPTVTVTIPAGSTGDLTQKVNFKLVNDGTSANFVLRSDQSWVTLDQETGFVDLKSEVPLSVTVVANGFDVGEYTAHVTITSPDDVSVTFTVVLQVIGIRIAVNPSTVAFSLVAGSSGTMPVLVTGLNGAAGQIIVERDAGGGWLTWSVAPITGELPATVTVMANTEGLAIGSYTGKLRVSCYVVSTQCTPQVINVALQVVGLSQLNVNPNSLFYATNTSAPVTQTSVLTLTNTGIETNFTTTIVNLPGVSVSPSSGTVRPNQPVTINVTANPNGVAPGRYSGSIQFVGAGSTATVSVSLQITGIGVSQSTVTLSGLKGRLATATFVVTGTEPFTIQRQSGGPWLTFAPTFGVAPQTITVTADAATLPEGLSQGSLLVDCGADCLAKTVNVRFNVTALRVVSSADYKAGLAPGTIAAAFGPGITTATQIATLPLPVILADVSVGVQDSAGKQFQAPLFFVSPGQVNFLVPEGVALGPAIVTIRNSSGVYASDTFTITAVAPS
ncbi:MAG TPA: hypothetical protein VGP79_08105, partial [Bryobacteraceae bacterium]|nr:hypothetical protein [Bryobacteraceae bacterium]